MDYILVGKIVNTHGIKGEVRIISDFSDKTVFLPNNKLYLTKNYEEVKINTYRTHKNYDMVTFDGICDINDVLKYKGVPVYVKKDNLVNHVIEEVIGFDVYGKKYIGKVNNLVYNSKYPILVLDNSMIPYIDEFVISVDYENKKIYIKEIEGLINED